MTGKDEPAVRKRNGAVLRTAAGKFLCSALFFGLWAVPCRGMEHRVYRSIAGGDTIVHEVTIRPAEGGFEYVVRIFRGAETQTDTLRLDTDRNATSWTYTNTDGERSLFGERRGNIIVLRGEEADRPVKKTYDIDGLPWKQFFPFDLEPFARSDGAKMQFWSVGTMGPGNLKCARFTAKKRGEGRIRVMDGEVDAVMIRVNLSGWMSTFWHADYWFDRADGTYMAQVGFDGPGELIRIDVD